MSPLKCLAELVLPHRPYHLAVSPGEEAIIACSQEGAFTILSPALQVLGSFNLGVEVDGIAVSPDGKYLGFSLRDRTRVMTARGEIIREARHDPWSDEAGGGCTFSPDGRFFWSMRPGGEEGEVSVEVADCGGWQVVATEAFEAEEDGHWVLVPHPEGEVVGLWIGAGQNGLWLYWSGIEDGWLYIEEEPALVGTGLPVFHPAGGEFLTESHDNRLLRRHRFPSGKVIRKLSEAEAFPPDDAEGDREKFGDFWQYMSDHRALILSSNYTLGGRKSPTIP